MTRLIPLPSDTLLRKGLFLILVQCVSALAGLTIAQTGTNDATFNSLDVGFGYGDGANASIKTAVIQPDGNVLVGGLFTGYNGQLRSRIARIDADGRTDLTLNPGTGTDDFINTVTLQPDGKIILCGGFSSYDGTARNYIVRINADGSMDSGFDPGTGASTTIDASILLPDNKIIIAGGFTSYNGTARNRLARLNVDGSLDATFTIGTGANNVVRTVSRQSDGKMVVGGNFTAYNGTSRNRIARINADGTHDTSFNPGTGANGVVWTSAIQSDGKIIIGGQFTTVNGTSRNYIARLNANGSLDTSFNAGSGPNATVNSIFIQSDGKIIIGGQFQSIDGTTRNYIGRLNADGSLDAGFDGLGANSTVLSMTERPDGKLLITGAFTTYAGLARNRIALVNSDGSPVSGYNTGTGADNSVQASVVSAADGKVLIGGQFLTYNGVPRQHVARLNRNGTLDTTFDPGTDINYMATCIAIQPDEKVLVGGENLIRLNADGTIDNTFSIGAFFGTLWDIEVLGSGKILISGDFSAIGGFSVNNVARLNSDGSVDLSFTPATGPNNIVFDCAIQPDNKIVICGGFTAVNGTARNSIARLNANGTLDATFNPGTGANAFVRSVAFTPDNELVVVGDFTLFNGQPANRIARLNMIGQFDNSFATSIGSGANSTIAKVSVNSDESLIITGDFISFDGVPSVCIAQLTASGTLDTLFDAGIGANAVIYTHALQGDGRIIIGGEFTAYGGVGRNRVARVIGTNLIGDVDLNSGLPICAGVSATLSFTTFYTANAGNVFTAELSDATGSYASPVVIGTLSATTGGTMNVSIPPGSVSRIRIRGSDPVVVATDVHDFFSVLPLPDNAGGIIGSASVCQGASSVSYSVPVITHATSYNWTLPAGASIFSGSGSDSITVQFSSTASTGNIYVAGVNACGTGALSAPFNVSVIPGSTWYQDLDEDGYHAGGSAVISCASPGIDYIVTTLGVDCDDSNPDRSPSASEICEDAIDNDCDGSVDELCAALIGNDSPTYAINLQFSTNNTFPNCIPIAGTLSGATDSPQSGDYSGADKWYRFTAQTPAVSISLNSGVQDDYIGLYEKVGSSYVLLAFENASGGTSDFERLNYDGLTPGTIYFISVGTASGALGGAYSFCLQHLMPSGCATSVPAGGLNLCSSYRAVYRGAPSQGVTYSFIFSPTGTTPGSPTTVPGTNGLIVLSNPLLGLRYGGTYSVEVNTLFSLTDGVGAPEPISVGGLSTGLCSGVSIIAEPQYQVRVAQACPTTLRRSNWLIGDRMTTALCGTQSFTYEFTQIANCGDGTVVSVLPTEYTTASTAPYLQLGVLSNLPSTGVWSVRLRPNFAYGSGNYGPSQRIQVLNTSASGMLSEGAVESEERSATMDLSSVAIYPNPSNGEFINLSLNYMEKGQLHVRVLDAAGRSVTTRNYAVEETFNTLMIFDEQLSEGVYMIETTNGGNVQTQRLIVQ